jgi:tetratricopeptide (TPR) repeat protein
MRCRLIHWALRVQTGAGPSQTKEYGLAVDHFNKSIGIAPSSVAYTVLGSAYYGLKQYPQAIEAYQEAIRMVPNSVELHL